MNVECSDCGSKMINMHERECETCDSCRDESIRAAQMIEAKIQSEYELNKPFYHPYSKEELESRGWTVNHKVISMSSIGCKIEIDRYGMDIYDIRGRYVTFQMDFELKIEVAEALFKAVWR